MAAYEYYRLEANILNPKDIRKLPVESEQRKRRIIGRCNWYMFSSSQIRGSEFRNHCDFFRLCRSAEPNCPPEQEKPNREIADKPPSKTFLAKYLKAYRQGSKAEVAMQDTVAIDDIHKFLIEAWERWNHVSVTARRFEEAIDNIPKPERIKKVVCLGLGRVLTKLPYQPDQQSSNEDLENMVQPRNIAQHIAAIAIVKQLERKTGQKIHLYTADPEYGPQYKKALETLPFGQFTVLDPSFGKHEQFTVIDDNTVVFNMTCPPQCPTLRIIQEYARPVAIITKEVPRTGKFQDRLWFEVTEEDGNKVRIPGCADLPFPDGCLRIGGLCPKRVRDMIVHEYYMEDKFPAEEEKIEHKWGICDLVDYQTRDIFNTNVGGYWRSDTRLYVRKHGAALWKGRVLKQLARSR